MINNEHVYAVILAGGGGTRLWPKSRKQTPKQFLKLAGKKTMIQATADRMSKLVNWDKMIVVTNKLYIEDIKQQLPEIPEENVIAEPAKKDTALAMLIGSLYAQSRDPEAVIVNAASDHIVQNDSEYIKVMEAAVKVAQEDNYLVSVGITPTDPNTGFGYIKIGEDLTKLDRGLSLFKVDNFTEKPNEATARAYLSTGKYFWNANMYVWSSYALTEAFKKYAPDTYQLCQALTQLDSNQFKQALAEIYDQAESISIDYAISEKADNLVLIPGDFGWNDVGLWKVVYDLGKKDLHGNVVISDKDQVPTLTVNSENNLIHANGRLVAMFGIDDLIVIDTDEILLIAPKGKSSEIKKIVNRLKEEGKEEYL